MEKKEVQLQPTTVVHSENLQVNFKLKHTEFMTLSALLSVASCKPTPKHDMYEKLLHYIIVGLYKKFFYIGIEIKDDYTVGFSHIECVAFWLYFTDHPYTEATLTGRILDRMNEIILEMFAA